VEADTEWVNSNPNTVKALLRAWIRAQAYYEGNHEEAVAFISEMSGDDEQVLRAYLDNPHFDINTDPMKTSVERAWNYMDRIGLLNAASKNIDIDEHINTTLYKEALDECQSKFGEADTGFYEKMQAQYSANDQ
jgi:NitT/TauT family transport system substrate-binding protein